MSRWTHCPGSLRALQAATGHYQYIRLLRTLYQAPLDRDALADMAGLPALADSWRHIAQRRLATNDIEDWTRRLETPAG